MGACFTSKKTNGYQLQGQTTSNFNGELSMHGYGDKAYMWDKWQFFNQEPSFNNLHEDQPDENIYHSYNHTNTRVRNPGRMRIPMSIPCSKRRHNRKWGDDPQLPTHTEQMSISMEEQQTYSNPSEICLRNSNRDGYQQIIGGGANNHYCK